MSRQGEICRRLFALCEDVTKEQANEVMDLTRRHICGANTKKKSITVMADGFATIPGRTQH